jgi:hypothetical protein
MRYRVLALTALLCCWPVVVLADEETYAERLARRPMPTDEAGRKTECAWIRQEDARLQNLLVAFDMQARSAAPGPYNFTPIYRAQMQMGVRDASAALASRAADVGCTAAFSNAPAIQAVPSPAPQQGMSFDECFQKCKQYTSRSNEQCFDSCRSAPVASDSPPQPFAPQSEKRSCSSSSECPGELLCVEGRCVAYTPSKNSPPPSPLTQPSSGNKQVGDSCSGHFDCAGRLHCGDGRCVP